MSDAEIRIILERIDVLERKLDPALDRLATVAEKASNTKERLDIYWNVQVPKCEEKFRETESMKKAVNEHDLVLKAIKTEKYNTTKNSQYRIALIVSIIMGVLTILNSLLVTYLVSKVWK